MTISSLAEIVRHHMPGANLGSARLLGKGQNGSVLLAGGVAYKFAGTEAARMAMRSEVNHLMLLRGSFSFEIPEVVCDFLHLPPGEAFFGYLRVEGKSLTKGDYILRPGLFGRILEILGEIHSLPVEKLREKRDKSYYRNMLEAAQAHVFLHLPKAVCSAIEIAFARYLAEAEYMPSAIHGDLGAANMIYRPDMGKIVGIVDWEQLSIGDPVEDAASLGCPASLGAEFLNDYFMYVEDESERERVRFYISTFALQEAVYGIKNNLPEALIAGVQGCIRTFSV